MHVACGYGHVGVVKRLLNSSLVDPNFRDVSVRLGPFDTCQFAETNMYYFLFVQKVVDGGETPLVRAASFGRLDVVKCLLDSDRVDKLVSSIDRRCIDNYSL